MRIWLTVAVGLLGGCSQVQLPFGNPIAWGDEMFHKGDFGAARRFYLRAVRQSPMNGTAYLKLGLAQANGGDAVGAIASMRRALQLLPAKDARRRALKIELADLSLAFLQGSEPLDESEATAKELLHENPRDYDGLRILGAVALARAESLRSRDKELYAQTIGDAQRNFEWADGVKPGQLQVTLALARVHATCGRFPEAESRYRALVAADPPDDAIRAELYRLLLVQGKRSEARQVLRAAGSAAERPEWFLALSAAQDLVANDRSGLDEDLDRIRRLPASNSALCVLIGDFHLRAGDAEGALRDYRSCQASGAGANLRDERLIKALVICGRSAEASQVAQELLKRNSRDPVARTLLASEDIRRGDPDRALGVLEAVSAEDGGDYEARLELARAHWKRGEMEQASQIADDALQLRPDYLPALVLEAQLQFQQQDYAGAALTVKKMLAIDTANREAHLMNEILRLAAPSDAGKASGPLPADVAGKIVAGRFADAENLLDGMGSRGSADRQMPGAAGESETDAAARLAYLKNSECDNAIGRYRNLAASSPGTLTGPVAGPWIPLEQRIPKLPFVP